MIDFEALWSSDKLSGCAEWAQAEYAWLYGLADANGSFEITNLRVIWGKVAAIRKNLSIERLEQIFSEFNAKGLLFIWEENGKSYGHWTGSDKPGRLPRPSYRKRMKALAIDVPSEKLSLYLKSLSLNNITLPREEPHAWVRFGLGLVREGKDICASLSGSHDTVFSTPKPVDEELAAVNRVWAYYLDKLQKNPKLLTLTDLRKTKGLARLREAMVKTKGDIARAEELMKCAVDNLAASEWHCGENPKHKRYDSWEKNLFSSTEQFERWLE